MATRSNKADWQMRDRWEGRRQGQPLRRRRVRRRVKRVERLGRSHGDDAGDKITTRQGSFINQAPEWLAGMRAYWACARQDKAGVAVLLDPYLAAGVTPDKV
eukprot:gene46564-28738_t